MSRIDYFNEENKQSTNASIFGLCDDNDKQPAYLDTSNRTNWIGIIENKQEIEIVFYPIDNSVEIKREDGTDAQRCEGIVSYDNLRNLLFVELKDRRLVPADWLHDASEQIKESMRFFFDNYEKEQFSKIRAWICNKQLTNQNYWQKIKQFKKDTNGVVLYVQKNLSLPL